MQTRDNDRILELLAEHQAAQRSLLVELANAGASPHVLSCITNAMGTLDGAVCSLDDSGQFISATAISPPVRVIQPFNGQSNPFGCSAGDQLENLAFVKEWTVTLLEKLGVDNSQELTDKYFDSLKADRP